MEACEVDTDLDRDIQAALALMEMADDQGNIQVDGETADAIRAAEWIPSSDEHESKGFAKIGRNVTNVNVSFEKYAEVYGSRVTFHVIILPVASSLAALST